jgi:Mor family transcriptional regulator
MREVYVEMDPSKIKFEYLNGAYNDIANLLGIDAAIKLHAAYRGQQITFPVQLFTKEFIVAQIVNEYDGYNVKQLATKFGYSEKWIRKILKDHIDET